MQKIALFIAGLLLGINVGYMIMMPTRDSYKNLAHECVDGWTATTAKLKQCSEYYKEDTAKLSTRLNECEQNLSLLQGRSR